MSSETINYVGPDGEPRLLKVRPQNHFPSGRQLIEVGFQMKPAEIFLGFRSQIRDLVDNNDRASYYKILSPEDPRVLALQEKNPNPGAGDSRGIIPYAELMPEVA